MRLDRKVVLLLAALGGAAVIAGVLIAVLATTGSKHETTPAASEASPPAASTFASVPQHGAMLGSDEAPATLTVYEDPQCPYCRLWSLNVLPTVVQQFVQTGRVKLIWNGIAIIDANSVAGLRGAYAAGRQNRLWDMVEAMYRRQGAEGSGWITKDLLRDAGHEAGVETEPMIDSLDSGSVTSELRRAAQEATLFRVQGTPSFFLSHGIGPAVQLPSSMDATSFADSLASALG